MVLAVNEMGAGYSDQSSVSSWLVQPIKELSSAAGQFAGRGCALIRQLANSLNSFLYNWNKHNMQEVNTAMTQAVEQLRSQVESDAEALRLTLSTDGDEVMRRLESACSKLQQHLDDLNTLATHCSAVNETNLSVYILQQTCAMINPSGDYLTLTLT